MRSKIFHSIDVALFVRPPGIFLHPPRLSDFYFSNSQGVVVDEDLPYNSAIVSPPKKKHFDGTSQELDKSRFRLIVLLKFIKIFTKSA